MRSWLLYAITSGVLVALAGLVVSALMAPSASGAVWFGGGSAWVIQALAFAALVWVRARRERFLWGWAGGIGFRFVAVVVLAFWVTRRARFPAAPALISLVAFVFVLVLIEPLFLRIAE